MQRFAVSVAQAKTRQYKTVRQGSARRQCGSNSTTWVHQHLGDANNHAGSSLGDGAPEPDRPLFFFTGLWLDTRGVPSLRPASSSFAKFLKKPFTPMSWFFFFAFLSLAYRTMRCTLYSLFQYPKIMINVAFCVASAARSMQPFAEALFLLAN